MLAESLPKVSADAKTYSITLRSPKPDPPIENMAVPLKGDIPSPMAPPSGCVFRTRCPHAIDACAQTLPPLDQISPGRFSACMRKDLLNNAAA